MERLVESAYSFGWEMGWNGREGDGRRKGKSNEEKIIGKIGFGFSTIFLPMITRYLATRPNAKPPLDSQIV